MDTLTRRNLDRITWQQGTEPIESINGFIGSKKQLKLPILIVVNLENLADYLPLHRLAKDNVSIIGHQMNLMTLILYEVFPTAVVEILQRPRPINQPLIKLNRHFLRQYNIRHRLDSIQSVMRCYVGAVTLLL